MHPLAGQQDILRRQFTQQAEAGPSGSPMDATLGNPPNESDELSGEEEPGTDVETMSAAEGWFSSLSADENESLRSSPSPTEDDMDGQVSLLASVQEVLQHQLHGGAPSSSGSTNFSVIRRANQPTLSMLSAEKRQAELIQLMSQDSQATSSPAREGGILRRLRRISKKEKGRAEEAQTEELDAVDLLEDETQVSSSHHFPSPADLSSLAADPATLTLRDAAREKTPQVEGLNRERIHSIQPSLVDDESLAGRDSRPDSPLLFDDDDLEQRLTMGRSEVAEVDDIQSLHGHIGFIGEGETGDEAESEFDDGAAAGDGDKSSEWRLENIPGSFIFDGSSFSGRSVDSPSDSESKGVFAAPTTDMEPLRPEDIVLHEDEASEYREALSRQPSSYTDAHERFASLQVQDEDGAATPRAAVDDGRTSYFAAAVMGSSTAPTMVGSTSSASVSTPTRQAPQVRKTYTWYQAIPLTGQQRYSFLRHIFSRELIWESQRLFLLSKSSDLFQPSSRESLPKTDLGYFKGDGKGIRPCLPLIRFLFTHVFSTCPLFGPSQPIEGAAADRARTAGARTFFDEALLPLLRFRQTIGLGCSVDIHGEWPGECFDSPNTLGVISGSLFKLVTRLTMAIVLDKKSEAWNWSAMAPPSLSAYLAHRVTPSQLKQGGMEVNIVGARLSMSSKECELLVSVRRFGFPPCFVVRTESDFYEYARGLAEELGRRSRIRAVPPPAGQNVPSETPNLESSVETGPAPRKAASREQIYDDQPGLSAASLAFAPPVRPRPVRVGSSESIARFKGRNRSSTSLAGSASPRLSSEQLSPTLGQQGQTASPKSTLTEKSRFFYRNKAVSSTEINESQTSLSQSIASSTIPPAPLTLDEEARRKQLRAWLRDALSVRGAGHANETLAFLSNGSFPEKDIKAATKKDVQQRMEVDDMLIKERERSAATAHDEIMELRKEMLLLWRNCVEGNELTQAHEAVKAHDTFSALPLPYQRVISWTNLQVGQFLHHTFLNSHESRRNFDRATELVQCIPWKHLSLALREPTGLMIQKVKSSLTHEFILKKILALQLEDVPAKKLDTEVLVLKKRLGSTILRKLQGYVHSEEWQRRVVRKASKLNNIPLVSAIVRGSDKPLLAAEGIKRIVSATRVYQEFLATKPTYEEHRAKAKANVDVRLICDMQRALRLLTLKRNGEKVRAALSAELKAPIQAFLEPFFSLLKRLHRTRLLNKATAGGVDAVTELQRFMFKLLDVIAGLKMRVQDAWRSVNTLTLFLDDAVPSWYQLLHRFANVDGLLLDLTMWVKGIAALFRAETSIPIEEIASHWQPPKDGFNRADMTSIAELTAAAKRKRGRQMEAACRWAAGDTDADHCIQVQGEAGKTRITPYTLPTLPAVSSKTQVGLEAYLTGLRAALDNIM